MTSRLSSPKVEHPGSVQQIKLTDFQVRTLMCCDFVVQIKETNRNKNECRHEERRRKCVTTAGDRGGHRVNPARISAPDETKIARRRIRLHTARQCRRAGTAAAAYAPERLSVGKLTLRLIAERAEASPICGGGAAGSATARRRRATPRSPSHLTLQAISGLICFTVYAKFYTFLNIYSLSMPMTQSFFFALTHAIYFLNTLNIKFQEPR